MKSLSFSLACCVTCIAAAKTNTLVNGATDWRLPGSFIENRELEPGDVVVMPEGGTATVTDDSAAIVSSLERIIMSHGDGQRLIIDVSTNTVFKCTINDGMIGLDNFGTVVKKGIGEALFAAYERTNDTGRPDYVRDFAVRLEIEKGDVRFPDLTGKGMSYFYVPFVTLAEGTRLFTPGGCAFLGKYINGYGCFTNDYGHTSYDNRMQLAYGAESDGLQHSDFYGRLDVPGHSERNLYFQNRINLHATNSIYTGSTYISEYSGRPDSVWTGIKRFGNHGEPSSIGVGRNIHLYASRVIYLGTGESTDKYFFLLSSMDAPAIIDGGECGGLDLAHQISNGSGTSTALHRRLELTGDHTNVCKVSGKFPKRLKDDVWYTCHLTKSGTGVWHLCNPESGLGGGIAVENGVLRFDSINPKGVDCSLGDATVLTDAYAGTDYLNHLVDYAILLGGADSDGSVTEGTLEYVGSGSPRVTDRPVVVKTRGRIAANGGTPLELGDFRGLGSGDKTLTLDGTNTARNTAIDIRDGDGKMSVVKDGSGSWALMRTTDGYGFTGSLDVNRGTLTVAGRKAGEPFSWFKLVYKENAYAAGIYKNYDPGKDTSTKSLMIHKFMLFDHYGTAQAVELEEQAPGSALEPGQIAYEHPDRLASYPPNYNVMLSNAVNKVAGHRSQIVANKLLDKNDPDTWISVCMRLTNGAPAIAAFDYSFYYSQETLPDYASRQNPTAMELLGSVDGVNWESLWSTNYTDIVKTRLRWEGAKTKLGSDTGLTETLTDHVGGFPLHHSYPTNAVSTAASMLDVTSFSVTNGATLKTDGGEVRFRDGVTWRISAEGAGRIEGFSFPENGTVEVSGFPDGQRSFRLPGEYVNVTGLENVTNWTFISDAEFRTPRSVVMKDGDLWVVSHGLRILVR